TRGVGDLPAPHRPRHDVQVIELEAVRSADRVVAAWHQNDVAILDAEGLVQRPIVRVDALESEARRGRKAVIVDLLELGLPDLLAVVLVRRVARPVASRCEHLDDQESLGRRARRQYVANVAGVGARAPHLIADILRADQPRRCPPFAGPEAPAGSAVGPPWAGSPGPPGPEAPDRLAV